MHGGKGATRKRAEGKRLKDARRRLMRWRRGRRGGRIPNELWQMAAEAAAACGIETTASRLELDAERLQQWVGRLGLEAARDEQPTFVELPPFVAACPAQCTVEMEEPCGRKVRISLEGQATAQVLQLGQVLWRDRP